MNEIAKVKYTVGEYKSLYSSNKLDYVFVQSRLTKFRIINSIQVQEGRWLWLEEIYRKLLAEGFTNLCFANALDDIERKEVQMYGKMPNLAMFLKYRPYRYVPPARVERQIEHSVKPLTEMEKRHSRMKVETLELINYGRAELERIKEKERKVKRSLESKRLQELMKGIKPSSPFGNLSNQLEETK